MAYFCAHGVHIHYLIFLYFSIKSDHFFLERVRSGNPNRFSTPLCVAPLCSSSSRYRIAEVTSRSISVFVRRLRFDVTFPSNACNARFSASKALVRSCKSAILRSIVYTWFIDVEVWKLGNLLNKVGCRVAIGDRRLLPCSGCVLA